jgi:cytoskeletal protein RodZ
MVTESDDISVGKILSDARKKKRLRYKKLSSELKIDQELLIALEKEDFDKIPGGEPYIKGFLRAYAKKLDVNPDEIIELYTLIDEGKSREKIKQVTNDKSNYKEIKFLTPKLIGSISSIAIVFIFYLLFKPSFGLEKQSIADNSSQNKKKPDSYLSEKSSAFKETSEELVFLENTLSDQEKVKTKPDPQNIETKINNRAESEENEIAPAINKPLDRIRIQVFDDCWLEVYSPDKRLLYRLARKGEDYFFEEPLVKVIAGNSKNIDLSYNGELVMLDKLTNKNLVSCVVLPAGECSEFRTPNK